MRLRIAQFAGEMPIVAPNLLPENYATETLNARMEGGSLVPIRSMAASAYPNPASNVKSWSIYPFNKSHVLTRTDEADFVRGPLANDAWSRVYIAGDALPPQVAFSSGGAVSVVNLGINKPQTPTVPSSWNDAEPPNPDSQVVRCAYYVTAVTSRGEESEPSETTQIINRWDGASIPITLGANNDSRAATRRIYRTEGGGTFNFVAEIPVSNTTYLDSVTSANLKMPCQSETWNPPPTSLKGLTMVGNGFMAGFFNNTLCFCEPYHPHAWPLDYQLAFPDDVVSIASVGGALVVATKGSPWIVAGGHPAAMQQTPLDVRAACLSRRGHVDMGDYSLYPTNDGLMMASPNGMQLVSQGIYSRHQWGALQPHTFKAFRYRGRYLCFAANFAFIFDLESGVFPLQVTEQAGDTVIDGHYQADENHLYLLIQHSNNTLSVQIFDEGSNKTMRWKSREFVLSPTMVFSAGRIDADSAAEITLSGEGYAFSYTANNDNGFRLPSGRPRRLTIEVSSSGRVNELTLASSMGELI